MTEELCNVNNCSGGKYWGLKADALGWSADKDYDSIVVTAIRGTSPAISYSGSGSISCVWNKCVSSQYTQVYVINNVKKGDYVQGFYYMCVTGAVE